MRRLSTEEKILLNNLYKEGHSIRTLQKETGIPLSTIENYKWGHPDLNSPTFKLLKVSGVARCFA